MRRMRAAVRALGVALLAFALLAKTAVAGQTGQITGTVVDATTKKAIAGASVRVTSLGERYDATTDAKGEFVIVDVTPDTYAIVVDAKGYFASTFPGVTVTADETYRLNATLSVGRIIARTAARSRTSPFQPTQTVDRYNLGSDEIAQFIGKDFNTSGQRLLAALPSVTVDRQGTPLVRGGFGFQLGYEVEGIDYREPSRSLTNRFENFGNSNLINGVSNVEVIPGGGDATHGDTGTGLIALTIKRGTQKPITTLDLEGDVRNDVRQIGFEDGRWLVHDGILSNYLSYIQARTNFQYGPYGTDPGSIGASPITSDPAANSNINANSGALYTTAYYNASQQNTSDFIDNLVLKFGRNKQQSLQFFYENQLVTQYLNYGGLTGLTLANPFPPGLSFGSSANSLQSIFAPPAVNAAVQAIYPQFPYGQIGGPITQLDQVRSPFTALKLDFRTPVGQTASFESRYYRTLNSQSEYLAEQGIYSTASGGIRTGVGSDISKSLGAGRHLFQLGGKYEFVHPYGTVADTIDYDPAFAALSGQAGSLQISTASQTSIVPDFVAPIPTGFDVNNNLLSGTPGCNGNVSSSGGSIQTAGANCGYLSRFFKNGVPSIPPEVEVPTANQQTYGLYFQDTYSPSDRLKALLGLRLDGYNFLLPNDPQNPPALDGVRHQRLYEPHLGLSYRIGAHDGVRANFGSTLSIPLPTFLGLDIDRNAYAAFANVPSYDNSKGPFDPSRPQATAATYCGPATAQTSATGQTIVQGTQPCANYADQLYWLYRNYRFGLQSLFKFPLRGATFTNYDLSYSHEFADGTALRVTPFDRRGFNVVETSRTLLGWNPLSEVASLSPEIYSNLGTQSASGIEFYLTHPLKRVSDTRTAGFSYQISATYLNQIGNDPPGTYLPTASVQLGELYPSPNLARFQSTIGLTYKTEHGLRINPVLTIKTGYPYGSGVSDAFFYQNFGNPVFVPLTDAITNGLVPNFCQANFGTLCLPSQGSVISNATVDPQNPGTVANPTIIGSRGTESASSSAGLLRAPSSVNLDIYVESSPPNTGVTYGIGITNVFDQTADVPVANLAEYLIPLYTGSYFDTGHLTGSPPTHSQPTTVGPKNQSYIVYPNQPPIGVRAYVELKL